MKAAIFGRCLRAMRAAEGGGKHGFTLMHIENIKKARMTLRFFIRDLFSPRPQYEAEIRAALKDVHPRTEYCGDMVACDVSDICVTLSRLEQRRRRANETKHTEALHFIQYLKDEFAGEHLQQGEG